MQNNTSLEDLGAASSVVSFFRSLGGSVGVSALGAVLSSQVAGTVRSGLAAMGVTDTGHRSQQIPDLDALPAPVRDLYEQAFGTTIGHLFLISVPFAILGLVCVLFIEEVPLRTTVGKPADVPADADKAGATAPVPASEAR